MTQQDKPITPPPLDPSKMPRPEGVDTADHGNGIATPLQPGGLIPGGGPGSTFGSVGTGGGSNADRPTGDAEKTS